MLKISHKLIIFIGLISFLCPNALSFGYLNNDLSTLSPKISISRQAFQTMFKHIDFDMASFSDNDRPGLVRLNPGWIRDFVEKPGHENRFTGIIRPNAKRNNLRLTPEFRLMQLEFEAVNEPGQKPYLHFMDLDNIHFSVIPWLQKTFPEEFNSLSATLTEEDIFWYYVEQFYDRLSAVDPFEIRVEGLWWGRPKQEQRISLRGFESQNKIREIESLWGLKDIKPFLFAGFIQLQRDLPEEISAKIYSIFDKYKHAPFMEFTARDMSLASITNSVLENDKSMIDIPLGRKNVPILREAGSLLDPVGFNKANYQAIARSL